MQLIHIARAMRAVTMREIVKFVQQRGRLLSALVRPLMILLTLPLTVLTFGLFLLVINALMLRLVAVLVPEFRVESFGAAFFGSLLLSLLNVAVAVVIGPAW